MSVAERRPTFARRTHASWLREGTPAYDSIRTMLQGSPPRPGLAKSRRPALVRERVVTLVSCSDAAWVAALDHADVVSEGAPKGDADDRSYFGSTSIVLDVGTSSDEESTQAALLASHDPHLRLRAVRVARREASHRADGPLARMHAEVTVAAHPGGVRLHVDVEARVLPDRRGERRPSLLTPAGGHANG